MGLGLERLVYKSTATGSTGSLLNLAAILSEAQRNNDRDGLTGALAAHNDSYIQVLEGAPPTLDTLMRRLERDPRHRDIVVMDRMRIETRAFGEWAMASTRITPELIPMLDAMMAEGSSSAARVVAAMREALAADRSASA